MRFRYFYHRFKTLELKRILERQFLTMKLSLEGKENFAERSHTECSSTIRQTVRTASILSNSRERYQKRKRIKFHRQIFNKLYNFLLLTTFHLNVEFQVPEKIAQNYDKKQQNEHFLPFYHVYI